MSLLDYAIAATESAGNASDVVIAENHGSSDWCDDLATIGGRVACVSFGQTWHKRGVEVNRVLTSTEAMRLAALDWDVGKFPMRADMNGSSYVISGRYAMAKHVDGQWIPFDGVAVGSDYTPIQNVDAFEFLDGMTATGAAEIETAGAIDSGKTVFITAKLPESVKDVIPGDEVGLYLVCTTTHDGSGSLWAFPCSFRTVCRNTVAAAHRQAAGNGAGWKIPHTQGAKQRMRHIEAIAQQAAHDFAQESEVYRQMAHVTAPADYLGNVLDLAITTTALKPMVGATSEESSLGAEQLAERRLGAQALDLVLDADAMERETRRAERDIAKRGKLLDAILEIQSSETNTAPGTVWAGYNAVTEYANSRMRYRGNGAKRDDTRARDLLTGRANAINQAAYQTAQAAL